MFSFYVSHECWCSEGSHFLHYSWFLVELLSFLHLCLTVGFLHFHVNDKLTLWSCTYKHIRIGMGGAKLFQGKRRGREFGWFCGVYITTLAKRSTPTNLCFSAKLYQEREEKQKIDAPLSSKKFSSFVKVVFCSSSLWYCVSKDGSPVP